MPASDTSTKVYENENDVVTINAGGKIFQVLRSTLCQPHEDTKFHKLFRNVDTTLEGSLFMDHDPEFIEIILNFLRMKKIEDPFDPIVEPPQIPSGKTKDFKRLLNHFDLTAFFYYPSTIPDATATVSASQMQKLHRIRKMSLDSSSSQNEDGHLHKHMASSQDSISSVDASITNEFDYCYG